LIIVNEINMHKTQVSEKLNFAVYICSTSRYRQIEKGESFSDVSGDTIQTLVQAAGHTILYKEILLDDKTIINNALENCLTINNLDVIIFSGGTGISPTDVTIETITPFLEKTLPGFGEFFRRLSYDENKTESLLTRATAGTKNGKAFFCIPGSPNAAKLAIEKLILPEAPHIIKHAREQHDTSR